MKHGDAEPLADQLGRMLAAVEAGELYATPPMRHRLTGAVVALRIVLGGEPVDVVRAVLESDGQAGTGTQ